MSIGKAKNHYTGEFKQNVVETMLNGNLSYCETARQFEAISDKLVASWERIYLEEGAEGLYIERRGSGGSREGRPRKLGKKGEEDLVAENQRLRMENDYLKKVNALVQEKQLQEKKRKWSGS